MSKINYGLLGILLIIIINIISLYISNTKISNLNEEISEIKILLEDIDNDLHKLD